MSAIFHFNKGENALEYLLEFFTFCVAIEYHDMQLHPKNFWCTLAGVMSRLVSRNELAPS